MNKGKRGLKSLELLN